MIRNLKKNRATFLALMILAFLTMNTLIGQINLTTNSSQSPMTSNLQPTPQEDDNKFGTRAPPSTYPTYTGSGTPRVAQETLWRRDVSNGDATHGFPILIDLPGTGYWTGTRLDITVTDIYEQKDWISNGNFAGALTNWVKNEDASHTGPAISIGTDTTYPYGQVTYGNAAYFRFASAATNATSPPQSHSTLADNTGDFGALTHWTNATNLGTGTPHKYISGSPPAVTPYPSGASGSTGGGYANWRVTNLNSTATPNNRNGAWMYYVGDTESAASVEAYTVTFTTTYTYSFSEFPVSSASFKLQYRYYSTDFDRGANYPGADPQDFSLYFSAYTASETLADRQIMSWAASGTTSPGDSGWVTSSIFDLKAAGLFTNEVSGDFSIVIKLVVHMCVDDGRTNHPDIWGNDDWRDDGNEDSDYLFFYVDGVELTATVPQPYGANVDPDITQTITFDRRNTTYGYLQFYYYVPSTFLSGRTAADGGLYLDVNINSQPTYTVRYSINSISKDGWYSQVLDWATISDDIGNNPGPVSFTVKFKLLFTVAGWYAKGSGQSIWLDEIKLYLENYANADLAQLKCYDEEHGNAPILWNYKSEHINSITNQSTWQTSTTSSRFWLNTTSSANIWLSSVEVKFYAGAHYQTVTPTFSLPTDSTGRTNTVTWNIDFLVNAISPGWRYNITIPSIPNWATNDWNVTSVKDSLNGNINFWTKPTAGSMKNISIYTTTASATGTWKTTCTSPNKITNFNITNQNNLISYEYYPGYTNRSRIGFNTGIRRSSSAIIWVNYTKPDGTPVAGIYPNTTMQPGSSYIMPYWTIPTNAVANDHYVAMVKWRDTDAFNDEVGFAAHYIQVYRRVSVSSVAFQQSSTLSTSKYVVAGEQLRISVDVTDPLVSPSLALSNATLTIDYPSKTNRLITLHKTLNLFKAGNMNYYLLETDGWLGDNWLQAEAWMGGTGNRTFTINLFGNSTYLNGVFQNYEIKGWFYILVDTHYALPYATTAAEQGISFTLAVELSDKTPGHNPAVTGIADSDKINNRTSGSPITDLDINGLADTWNGKVFMQWNIIPDNLTSWCAGTPELKNNPLYKWNGTLTLKEGYNNRYEARIKIPYDAIATNPGSWYYINVTTIILDNEWGWKSEIQYMTLTYDSGANVLKTYDDHQGCFRLDVDSATGFDTQIVAYPAHTLGNPLQYNWKDTSILLTRLYLRFTNKTTGFGFNSLFLDAIESWKVESWAVDPRVPESFGDDITRLQWKLVNSTTLLPDGITPDPYRENLANSTTWGWFYSDFNWTHVTVGLGTYENGLAPASFAMYVYAKLQNLTNPYKASEATFYIKVNPNPVNLTVELKYQGLTSFLDENYYPGKIDLEDIRLGKYYWGDILNFTIRAIDLVLGSLTDGISLRYYIEWQSGGLVTWGTLTGKSNGLYSVLFNTSDPLNSIGEGIYNVYFKGVMSNRSILVAGPILLNLYPRDTQLWPINISGVFNADSVNSYTRINDIRNTLSIRPFDPTSAIMTVPNAIITFSVKVIDGTLRNYTNSNIIKDANVSWYFRLSGVSETFWRLGGWSDISNENGIYTFVVNLSRMDAPFNPAEYGGQFELQIIPYKTNYDSTGHKGYYPSQGDIGATWKQIITIDKRPIALIPVTPEGTPKWDYQYSQSNWKYNPINFVVMDLITGENVSGCTIWYDIGTDASDWMDEYTNQTGRYYVIFDTWPSLFSWVSAGQKSLTARITSCPSEYGSFEWDQWDIARLVDPYDLSIYVESEGFLGPLTIYFWIILGCVGAVIGGFYSYKSYKFLTTPYVIRKIEESIDKISKDKKIAAGVMKSREHLVFLEATDLLKVVGIALRPPPEKKLPPVIEKLAPKKVEAAAEKIPELPLDVLSEELDKAGVRPEEKPLMLQQIKELGPADRQDFIQSLIGEDRYKELVEKLKLK